MSRWSVQLLFTSLVAFLLGFVSASPGNHWILKRQSSDGSGSVLDQVPEGCRTTCGPVNIILTGCGSTKCVCTDPNFMALKICMDCVVDYGTGTTSYEGLRSRGQVVLSNFGTDCAQQGARLSQLMLNPMPAPGPPGSDAVTAIPSFTTRADGTSSTGTGRPRGSKSSGGIGTMHRLSVSLASAAVGMVAGSAMMVVC